MNHVRPPKLLLYSLIFSAFIFLVNTGFVLLVSEGNLKLVLFQLPFPLWGLLAAVALLYAAKRSALHSRRLFRAWGLLAAARFLLSLGEITIIVLVIQRGAAPFPSLADGFFLSFYLLFLMGVLLFPSQRFNPREWVIMGLDMNIVLLAAVLGLWSFWLVPLAEAVADERTFVWLFSLAYPVGNLLLLSALLMLLYRCSKAQEPRPLLLLALGSGGQIVVAFLYGQQSLKGISAAGDWLSLGWLATHLIFLLAGVWQAVSVQPAGTASTRGTTVADPPAKLDTWLTYLPYGCAIAAFILLEQMQEHGEQLGAIGMTWCVGLIFALVILRQLMALRESDLLLAQVSQQKFALSQTNQELQAEIDERKRAELERTESDRLVRVLFEYSPDAVVLIDPWDPNVSWPIIDCNMAACQMNGYSRAELIGQSIDILNLTPGTPAERAAYLAALQAAGNIKLEASHRRRDGSIFPVEISTALITIGGRELVLGIDRDITERKQATDALHHSEMLFRGTFEQAAVGIAHVAPDGRWLRVNQQLCNIVGYTAEELLGMTFLDITHPADLAVDMDATYQLLRGEIQTYSLPKRYIHKNQRIIWVNLTVSLVRNAESTPDYFVTVVQEITQLKQVEEALRLTEARQRALLNALPDMMFRMSRDGTYLDCSDPRGSAAIPIDQIIGANIRDQPFLAEIVDEVFDITERAITTGEIQTLEYTLATPDGPRHYESRTVRSGPEEVVSVVRDVTERKQAEAQLAHTALHDALTGLPNRALFRERLRHAIEFAKRRAGYRFAVLFLDLDHFKVINDSLGHVVGDQLLITLAQRLRHCVRASDTVARLGGDEFVILVEDTDEEQTVITTAERIQDELKLPLYLEGQPLFVTASIGIVAAAQAYERGEDVVRDADLAMYHAKANGKARYALFTTGMREQAMTRMELENELRTALARHELELHYQPIVSLITEQITGFEALLRWRHPQRGLISPLEFIPIAEETGLIIPIGQWVLDQACRQLQAWQRRFPRTPALTMNVNVAKRQLIEPKFVESLVATLQATGLDPYTLHLEITESVCLNWSPATIVLFQQLQQLGVQIHLDDFGTGYSSLAYLHQFPIHTIKIDRSFVSRMDNHHNNTEIVQTVIALAHDLGMDAVAEGVETVEQLEQLKALNCNYVQGYFLSRPVDKAAIEKLLATPTSEGVHRPHARQVQRSRKHTKRPTRLPAV